MSKTVERPSSYDPFAGNARFSSNQARLKATREWYERHKNDYCHHDQAPPFAWSGYFRWLLETVEAEPPQ